MASITALRVSRTKHSTASETSHDSAEDLPRKWVHAHDELSRLARARALLEWEEGRALLAALRANVHRHLGFASFAEYVESLFGYKRRTTEEKVRVAEALESLPLLSSDLREGKLNWSSLRELTRVATAETEQAWRQFSSGKTVRQLEACVSGRQLGDSPETPENPSLRKHVLAFEVRAETLATFREALSNLRRDAGRALSDDDALLLMARHTLGGHASPGRASYQIAFTLCEQCGRGFQSARGEQIEVEQHIIHMAECDAQHIGHVGAPGRTRDMTSAASHAGSSVLHHSPRHAHATHSSAHVGVHAPGTTQSPSSHSATHAHTTLVTAHQRDAVESHHSPSHDHHNPRAHVGVPVPDSPKPEKSGSSGPSRATQSIPPAVRRWVMRRDVNRCVVPGCTHATFVDVHHLELRSEGGTHDPNAMVVVCSAHHRALHRGHLLIEGTPATGLVFRHADGTVYRGVVSPTGVTAQTQAFHALRRLGFREGDARRALDRVRRAGTSTSEDAAQVVRAALQVLTAAAPSGAA